MEIDELPKELLNKLPYELWMIVEQHSINRGLKKWIIERLSNNAFCDYCHFFIEKKCMIQVNGQYFKCQSCEYIEKNKVYKKYDNNKSIFDFNVITTKKNKLMGGCIKNMHPDVKQQVLKYKTTDLYLLRICKDNLFQHPCII